MKKDEKIIELECGRIVKLQKQGVCQRLIVGVTV